MFYIDIRADVLYLSKTRLAVTILVNVLIPAEFFQSSVTFLFRVFKNLLVSYLFAINTDALHTVLS